MGRAPKLWEVERDGRQHDVARQADVNWIAQHTRVTLAIDSAIPLIYEAYGTIVDQQDETEWSAKVAHQADADLVQILSEHGPAAWWLGYLDTGNSDIVFPRARKVSLYPGWRYAVVLAGPEEALTWTEGLPNLIFPADRSWLLNTLWDDSWTCIGGSERLLQSLSEAPGIRARLVDPEEDATPPGHAAI